MSPQPKRHLDQFSRFCRAHYCNRPTDHGTQSVTAGHIYVCSMVMRPKNVYRNCQTYKKSQKLNLTAARAAYEAELSSMMTLRTGHNDRNASSPSSPLPSCINSRMPHIAAADCSSPLPFFRHRSILSPNVIFLSHNFHILKITLLQITNSL